MEVEVVKTRSEGALLWSCDAKKVMFGPQELLQARLMFKPCKKMMISTLRGSEWSWWGRKLKWLVMGKKWQTLAPSHLQTCQ